MTIESLLRQALINLNQLEEVDILQQKFTNYLHSEMFLTIEDLKLAVDDKDSWSDLKLPGRLKLEMKRLLHHGNYGVQNTTTNQSGNTSPAVKWKRCYSAEYSSHYFLNILTNEAQWEAPESTSNLIVDDADDVGASSSYPDTTTTNIATGTGNEEEVISPGRRLLNTHDAVNIDHFYQSNELDYGTPMQSPRTKQMKQSLSSLRTSPPRSPPRTTIIIHDAVPVIADPLYSSDKHYAVEAHAEDKYSELPYDDIVTRLCEMGFKEEAAKVALEMNGNNLASAAAYLVADAKATAESDDSRCTTATSLSASGKSGKVGLPRLILESGTSTEQKNMP